MNIYSILKVHEIMHSEEKPYKCNNCDKCFKGVGTLKIHKRIHADEKQ